MIAPFAFEPLPTRVILGAGSLDKLGEEITRLGMAKALVLCTRDMNVLADDVSHRLGERSAGVFNRAAMHVPMNVARSAREHFTAIGADGCVAVGGGSTIGLAKAVALEFGIPILAIPTTYAGSEMTPIWGITEDGVKRTGTDRRVLPRTVLYDPTLTFGLPPSLSGVSGVNAIAHCVEALYALNGNPVISLMAEEGIGALGASLPGLMKAPRDVALRTQAQYGAWLAGAALGAVGMAIHHKLCHTLGGMLNLPHAETHTAVLPHAVAYNREAAPGAMSRIAAALGVADAATGLFDLAVAVDARTALRDLGMQEADIARAADLAMANAYWNPRPVTRDGVFALLSDAYHGRRPTG